VAKIMGKLAVSEMVLFDGSSNSREQPEELQISSSSKYPQI